ncbi:MAG: flagellar protein FlgN [Bdellovibrionales bacterium]|nr:flagellar protein FlgN [Massilia sp.]
MPNASAHSTLQDELKLIVCLIDLMKQEQQCLVAADTDALETLTPLKTQLVEQLAQLASRRHAALASDGFAASEVGMESWLNRMGNPGVRAAWQQLLGKTGDAKELNRVNGMLINKQLSNNHALINAMRAPANAADTAFYGPSGQTTAATGKRGLVVG